MNESEGEESVVTDSEESDRTPSPSILSGIELLDRKTAATAVDGGGFRDKHYPVAKSKQSEAVTGTYEDDEQKRDLRSRTDSEMDRSHSPSAAYPFFKTVKNYHHSPVFTPPRKIFRPTCGDELETDNSQGPSTMELQEGQSGDMEVCSQVLFSGSQGSSTSHSLPAKHKGYTSVALEDENKEQDRFLPDCACSSSDKIIGQSTNCTGKLGEQVKSTGCGKMSDLSVTAIVAQTISDSRTTPKPSTAKKVNDGSPTEKPASSDSTVSDGVAVENAPIAGENSNVRKYVQKQDTLTSNRCFLQESGSIESASKLFHSCDQSEASTSCSSSTSSSACRDVAVTVIPKPTTYEMAQSCHQTCDPDKTLNPSTEDDSTSLLSLEEEYNILSANVEADGKSLAALKEKMEELQQIMKSEAQKIQQQRGYIMSCGVKEMSQRSQQQQKQELLNLSRKQKHLLHILNIHKKVANSLVSKNKKVCTMDENSSQSVTLPSKTTCRVLQTSGREITQGMLVPLPCVRKTTQMRAVGNPCITVPMADRNEPDKDRTQDVDSELTFHLSQNAEVQTPTPQLTLKVLIENGLLEPSNSCMSFLCEGRQVFGDLGMDGSIQSDGICYKTEKEWFKSRSGQWALPIRKPKLWSLIKYDNKPLQAFADQCRLLLIAKKIEPPKAEMAKIQVSTAKLPSYTREGRCQSRTLFDPSVIKSVVLIGDNELLPEDELIFNGFWENKGSCRPFPSHWLKDITSWEE